MSKVEHAVAWARRGFRVFTCLPDEPGKEGNAKRAKKPTGEGWTDWATTDEATIRGWWAHHDFNIGVLTDGFCVVDIDTKPGKDGMASWIALYGAFDTMMVKTPSGGYHLYYQGANVALNQGALGPGLDIRSWHGYTLAPGSTVDGVAYELVQDAPMQWAPPQVIERCKLPGDRAANAQTSLIEEDDPRGIALAVAAIANAPAATHGELSQAAFQLACKVRDFGISEAMCKALMVTWGQRCTPQVIGADLDMRVSNAYQYAQNPIGAKHPEVMFGSISIPPIPELLATPTAAAAMAAGSYFGNIIPLVELKPRPWVLRRLLLRGEVTTLIASGGVGKSLVQLMTAIFLANGSDMFSFENVDKRPYKSIIYNAEDSLDEMSMRFYALCQTLQIDPAVVAPRICLISGKTQKIKLVTVQNGVPTLNIDDARYLAALASDPDVAMVGLDPLNKLHNVNGIDNIQMTFVMEQIEAFAGEAGVAAMLSHHTSKPNIASSSNYAGSADAAQGASAVRDSARIMMTLMAPSEDDCQRLHLSGQDRRLYLRMDDAKMNRALASDETLWMRKIPVRLWNGEEVGGLDRADMVARVETVRQGMARTLATAILYGEGRAGSTATLKEAADMLRANDPIYEKLKPNIVRDRIMAYMSQPVKLPPNPTAPNGTTIHCVESNGAWVVLVS